jgi:hypothetical protein
LAFALEEVDLLYVENREDIEEMGRWNRMGMRCTPGESLFSMKLVQ